MPATVAKTWPIEAFAELPAMDSPELSPDGARVAARIAIKGVQQLVIAEVKGGNVRTMGLGENDLNWWRWVNNDWLIVGIGAETKFKHWGCTGPLIIDARLKPHHAPPLIEDPAVTEKVAAMLAEKGFLEG